MPVLRDEYASGFLSCGSPVSGIFVDEAIPGGRTGHIVSLLLRAVYWTRVVGKLYFLGRSFGFCNLLTMEEGVDHRVDHDYLTYRADAVCMFALPNGCERHVVPRSLNLTDLREWPTLRPPVAVMSVAVVLRLGESTAASRRNSVCDIQE